MYVAALSVLLQRRRTTTCCLNPNPETYSSTVALRGSQYHEQQRFTIDVCVFHHAYTASVRFRDFKMQRGGWRSIETCQTMNQVQALGNG